MAYQTLQNYKGSLYGAPSYTGIEYDVEVPDNTVVASPGGVSSTQHHYTKGFYGDGGSSWDFYAGQNLRYPYGEFGGMYMMGQNAPHDMGYYTRPPDPTYIQNQSGPMAPGVLPQNATVRDNYEMINMQGLGSMDDGMGDYDPHPSGPNDPYPPVLNEKVLEEISQTSTDPLVKDGSKEGFVMNGPFGPINITVQINPWIVIGLFILAFFCLSLWASMGTRILSTYLADGEKLSWKQLLCAALAMTGLFIFLAHAAGVPVVKFEGFP